jgi:2-dehydro-3-deoxygluconokinase
VADLYTLGEVMALFLATDTDDVATAQTFQLSAAGAEANVAVAVTRLGLSASLLTRLGKDKLGENVISALSAEGIDTSHIARVDRYTGALVRNRGKENPIDVTYLRTASAGSTICADDVSEGAIAKSRWVHLTGISVAISESSSGAVSKAMELARKNNIPISFDLNIRRKLWSEEQASKSLAGLVKDVELVIGGVDEFAVVWGSQDPEENLHLASRSGVKTSIMTAGDQKMRIIHQGVRFDLAPEVVETIDPVGSGDAFVGGTIAGILGGLTMEQAIAQGSKCGALVASHLGDWTGLPRGSAGVSVETLEKSR